MSVSAPLGPALGSFFERLLTLVLISGLVCEIYNFCHPVGLTVHYDQAIEAEIQYRFYSPPSLVTHGSVRD